MPGKETRHYGGNTSCVEFNCGSELIICDAGTGIRPLGKHLIRRRGKRPIKATILLSHVHWDHYVGLPFFKPLYWKKNEFVIGGPKPLRKRFGDAIGSAMHPPYFPIPVSAIPARIEFKTIGIRPFSIGNVRVVPFLANHPGGAFGWKFLFPGGKSVAHVSDNEPDGERREAIIEWLRNTDVLIHDAQYTTEEYKKRLGWGHSPYTYPLEIASEAGVSKLIFFHFDPDADDDHLRKTLKRAKEWIKRRNARLDCSLAREGFSFRI